jgi:hypothetical protein
VGGTTAFDMTRALYCKVGGDAIEYEEADETTRILEIIEGGNVRTPKPKPKKIWELTGEERNELWLNMQKAWYKNRETRYEVS